MVGRRAGLGLSIGPKEIVVAPGFALDYLGNEIEIEEPTRWSLRGAGRGTACYLTLAFAERAVDPGPVACERSAGLRHPRACRFSNSTRNASRLGSPRPRQSSPPERDT
jgi:hypothetical protein